ncbi:peptidoglycan-associated lipoprotein Pal [Novosphingobium panipatense]|uniref:Peptidoglycan-associated protein n=1 Tax=Novosphingobium panipatense TaxID=428991 RepID=A0ABY1Q9I6_9SPHN|nr:peptidoglycan-associated lipoprotein Pal [Novosphingobium panipatense]SMP61893.1 peptidoglycan-associated lipoprotein [Novosphingobium panipatense]
MPSFLSTLRVSRTGAVALVAAGALALSGCGKKAPAQLPPDPVSATAAPTGPTDSYGAQPGSQADFVAKMMGSDTIYFGLDRTDIDAEDQAALTKQAQWLQQYSAKRVTIEGHCDERGTREYNIALGERRANAAKNYLVSLGIDPARVTTVSYGKERPIALGSDEQSWAQNRRAVTVTID